MVKSLAMVVVVVKEIFFCALSYSIFGVEFCEPPEMNGHYNNKERGEMSRE
jgi:hypothetical protein